jgi:hypothetical protein
MSESSCTFKPGWQILEEAGTVAMANLEDVEAAKFLEIQLLARSAEVIPVAHRNRVLQAVLDACSALYAKEQFWPLLVANFFDTQFGKTELDEALGSSTRWELRDHGQSPVGYIILNKEYRAPVTSQDLHFGRNQRRLAPQQLRPELICSGRFTNNMERKHWLLPQFS